MYSDQFSPEGKNDCRFAGMGGPVNKADRRIHPIKWPVVAHSKWNFLDSSIFW